MTNLKRYNIFVTITSFAKLLVELFIPLLLFNFGFTIKEILLFLIIKYTFCTLLIPITIKLGQTISYTKIMIISTFIFSGSYFYMNSMNKNIQSLIILALLFSTYLIFYWTGRRIYALSIIEDKKITDNVSLYQIFTLIGGLPATYIGALILKKFNYITLGIIVLILMILSIIPLIKIKTQTLYKKTNIKPIIKTFGKRNYTFITLEQLRYISTSIFPLFIYINIKKEFSYIGIINIISGIGSIIYVYLLSKQMDKNKKDYIKTSSILLGIIYLLKIVITNSNIFLIIIFFEGIMKSALDTIVLRNTYAYGKNYDVISYIEFIELLNNITRTIFLIIFFVLDLNLKIIILISIISIILNGFIKFNDGKYGYKQYE